MLSRNTLVTIYYWSNTVSDQNDIYVAPIQSPSIVSPDHNIPQHYHWYLPTQSFQINLFLHILRCSGRIKAISSDSESSHRALSIGGSTKAKYRSFVDRFNSVGV